MGRVVAVSLVSSLHQLRKEIMSKRLQAAARAGLEKHRVIRKKAACALLGEFYQHNVARKSIIVEVNKRVAVSEVEVLSSTKYFPVFYIQN